MKYLLTVLSSGRLEYLDRTLASFAQMVTPAPAEVYVYDDGGTLSIDALSGAFAGLATPRDRYTFDGDASRVGMCSAHARCWVAAAASSRQFVFHIEDDMVFLRPTNLAAIADLLDRKQHLAQLTLLRCPWGAEVQYGGYIAQTPGWYERHHESDRHGDSEWIETTRNWANAPTLFRPELARRIAWPAEPGCETTIGPLILADQPHARFGILGAGEPWVAHIGVDRAAGSHGY